jgi:hypothetical protein
VCTIDERFIYYNEVLDFTSIRRSKIYCEVFKIYLSFLFSSSKVRVDINSALTNEDLSSLLPSTKYLLLRSNS